MPVPGIKDKSARLGVFIDAGAIYDSGERLGSTGMRYSTGVSATWISPMGPIIFSYAIPINEQLVDKVQRLQFTMGSAF